MHVTLFEWIVTLGVTIAILLFDVVVIGRRPHEPTMRECAIALSIYVGLALLFGGWVWFSPRQSVRAGVLRRLADRIQPVGGQFVPVFAHHGQLQGAERSISSRPCWSASSWL